MYSWRFHAGESQLILKLLLLLRSLRSLARCQINFGQETVGLWSLRKELCHIVQVLGRLHIMLGAKAMFGKAEAGVIQQRGGTGILRVKAIGMKQGFVGRGLVA